MSEEVIEGGGSGEETETSDQEVEVNTDGEDETESSTGEESDENTEENSDDDEESSETSGESVEDEEEGTEEDQEEEDGGQKSYKEEFKKHPELRKAFFEHRQYQQIFSSPSEAAEAYEEVQTFRDLAGSVDAGDINPVIQSVIEANPKAFEKFAVEFIANVEGMDPKLYQKVVAPEFSRLLQRATQAAKQNGNKSLFLAAQWMSNWIFGTAEPPNIQRTQPEQISNNGARKDIQARSGDFFNELGEEINSFLVSEAERNLDPNKVLPSALLNSTKDEIIKSAVAIIKKDVGAQNKLKVLRDQAARAGFNYESRKKIRDAYQTMMKPVIARMRSQKRDEAMKAIGKSVGQNGSLKKKKVIPSSSKMTATKRPVDAKDVDWSKTSTRDAIDGKYVMKAGVTQK